MGLRAERLLRDLRARGVHRISLAGRFRASRRAMAFAQRPLALTLGDPAGIGPDITLLAWAARSREAIPPFVLLGDAAVLRERARALRLDVPIGEIADASRSARPASNRPSPCLPITGLGAVVAGRPDSAAVPGDQAIDRTRRAPGSARRGPGDRHQPHRPSPCFTARASPSPATRNISPHLAATEGKHRTR